ncbi:MAG: aminotransferase class V-fold PLP-dependent enzyme [Candidatus Nanosalina sp.]
MRREDFPPLQKDLTYLDSACMSLRPEKVIEAVEKYYREYPACPGRSHHSMSEKASEKLSEARGKVSELIGAAPGNLMFTSGTTEGINTVAQGFDTEEVFISDREHNSNLAPWQRKDCEIRVLDTEGGLNFEKLESEVEEGDLVSLVHVSNLDGMKLDVEKAAHIARDAGAYTLVDAAQSVPHMPVDVSEFPVDFMAFSGHKMLGPSGTGGLYISERAQKELEPLKTGGGAVKSSSYSSASRKNFPQGFEAGLPNVAGLIGMGEAAEYLEDIGLEKIHRREKKLTERLEEGIKEIRDVSYISEGSGVVTLWVDQMESHQVALILDRQDIAVRSGMHCVHSYFDKKDMEPGVRASFHLYNDEEDVEKLLEELEKLAYVA